MLMMMMICYENGRIVRKNLMQTVKETVVAAADGGVYLIFFSLPILKECERE